MIKHTPLDRDIQQLLRTAERAVKSAIHICDSAKRLPYEKAYVSRVHRDLLSALGAISHVRSLGPLVEEPLVEKTKEEKPPVKTWESEYVDLEDDNVS